MDLRVIIQGSSRKDVNGKRGIALDFHAAAGTDPDTWRYTVKLDDGAVFKIMPKKLKPEPQEVSEWWTARPKPTTMLPLSLPAPSPFDLLTRTGACWRPGTAQEHQRAQRALWRMRPGGGHLLMCIARMC